MDECERLKRGRSQVELGELAPESDRTQVIADGPESLGPLRMVWSGLVLEETWMEGKPDASQSYHVPAKSSRTFAAGSGAVMSASPTSSAWTPSCCMRLTSCAVWIPLSATMSLPAGMSGTS